MTSTPLPDAARDNWVDRFAPERLRPWLKLGRFDRPIGIWLLLLPGWQGIALAAAMQRRWPDPWLIVAFALGAALMRAAGCAYNDIVDRDIDAKVARTASRPVASGRIRVAHAWLFIGACAMASFVILLTFNPLAVALGAASLLLVAAYPFMKRITWWPQAWLGLTFNWGIPLGFTAAASDLPSAWRLVGLILLPGGHPPLSVSWTVWLNLPAFTLYLAAVFWTLGYDTIYAVQDLEDDALVGVKSSARRLGDGVSLGVFSVYAVSIGLVFAAGWMARLGPLFGFGAVVYAAHLLRQPFALKRDDPARALRLFKSNRDAALILLAAIAAGAWRLAVG
ncbi:MAG TPA: UbiA family prenyltransferase [Caulobacteraceae bacterium]|nr:UbiA family prenyltransferase [Caulobacteraceae bacterium]